MIVGVRHMMFLSHSYDHRVVDGALGGALSAGSPTFWNSGRSMHPTDGAGNERSYI